ncbi:MAG: hypothetical protein JO189_31730 [Deltaproteobacteria bacterium]|nr:hypothetical protein [Deltaproteobacteria bacterium]
MSSTELSDKLEPTIDPRLFELKGSTFKDLSHAAAAKRAAYLSAMHLKNRAKLLTSSRPATTDEQALRTASADGQINRTDNFTNYGTAPGYVLEYGNQGAGQEGWLMHSTGSGDSSRMYFDFVFNDGSAPFTYIEAWMRGAPDNGKNSYVCLEEQSGADQQGGNGAGGIYYDEVDIVEYYGYPPNPRAEWTIYQNNSNGQNVNINGNVGHGGYPNSPGDPDPGHTQYGYGVYLESGNLIRFWVRAPNGLTLGTWERHISDGYVPMQPMYLYAGIWDCTGADPNSSWCNDGSGPVSWDTYMAISLLTMNTYVGNFGD